MVIFITTEAMYIIPRESLDYDDQPFSATVASTAVASTTVASTEVASTTVASTEVASIAVASTTVTSTTVVKGQDTFNFTHDSRGTHIITSGVTVVCLGAFAAIAVTILGVYKLRQVKSGEITPSSEVLPFRSEQTVSRLFL